MAIQQSTNGLRELALFAGAGGGILGGKLLGWRTVCAVERDAYAAQVLAQRQNDGILAPFPIWSDVCSFDGKPWRGIVDVISGGFPCQDISSAGKGAGITGERSGLWKEFSRIISEVRPRYVFVENSPVLTSRGLGVVLGDLAEMGFDAEWGVLGASAVGAVHARERIWIVAHSHDHGLQRVRSPEKHNGTDHASERSSSRGTPEAGPSSANDERREFALERPTGRIRGKGGSLSRLGNWEISSEPFVCRRNDGVAYRMDRLKALGNGQVPLCASTAFRLLVHRTSRN